MAWFEGFRPTDQLIEHSRKRTVHRDLASVYWACLWLRWNWRTSGSDHWTLHSSYFLWPLADTGKAFWATRLAHLKKTFCWFLWFWCRKTGSMYIIRPSTQNHHKLLKVFPVKRGLLRNYTCLKPWWKSDIYWAFPGGNSRSPILASAGLQGRTQRGNGWLRTGSFTPCQRSKHTALKTWSKVLWTDDR